MKYGGKLLKFLELSKLVYTQNFTNESNYIYFMENGNVWTSNMINSVISDDEILIMTTIDGLDLHGIGVPAKELHMSMKTMDNCTIEQKEDHILLTDGHSVVELKTILAEESLYKPEEYSVLREIKHDTSPFNKELLEFTDKSDLHGGRVHHNSTAGIYTTDVNSIHIVSAVLASVDFAVSTQVWSVFPHFKHLSCDKYFHLYTEDNIELVTNFHTPMDMKFLDQLDSQPSLEFTVKNAKNNKLLQLFTANTKKEDRIISVTVSDVGMFATSSDNAKGKANIVLSKDVGIPSKITFTVNPDKLYSCLKNCENFRIVDDVLIAVDNIVGSKKYIKIGD